MNDEAISEIIHSDDFRYLTIRNLERQVHSSKKDFSTN